MKIKNCSRTLCIRKNENRVFFYFLFHLECLLVNCIAEGRGKCICHSFTSCRLQLIRRLYVFPKWPVPTYYTFNVSEPDVLCSVGTSGFTPAPVLSGSAEQRQHIWNTAHLSSLSGDGDGRSFFKSRLYFLIKYFFSDSRRCSPPSSFLFSRSHHRPSHSGPHFPSNSFAFVCFLIFFFSLFDRLSIHGRRWLCSLGRACSFLPPVYSVFLKADKMKEPFLPSLYALQLIVSLTLPTLSTFPASFSSSIIVLWIFILPPFCPSFAFFSVSANGTIMEP